MTNMCRYICFCHQVFQLLSNENWNEVMLWAVDRRGSYGLYSYGLYSYGLYIYGLYSYGLYSYGLSNENQNEVMLWAVDRRGAAVSLYFVPYSYGLQVRWCRSTSCHIVMAYRCGGVALLRAI